MWWKLGLALGLTFSALSFIGFYEHGPGRKILDITPATVVRTVRISQVEEGGYFNDPPTPWLIEVDLGSGRIEVAEMPVKPRRGAVVCVVHSTSPLRGSRYEVIGYVNTLASRGRECELAAAQEPGT